MKKEKSAGAVIFIKSKEIKYLLLRHPFSSRTKKDYWGFPKGHQQNSEEEPLDVARRELLEETSLQIDYIIEKVPFLLEEYVYEKLDQKNKI